MKKSRSELLTEYFECKNCGLNSGILLCEAKNYEEGVRTTTYRCDECEEETFKSYELKL